METNITHKQSNNGVPISPEQAFKWPREAMQNKDWPEAAKRWAILRKAYPNHPAPWFQGANAHIKANELDEAENLLAYARQHFPNHPKSLTYSASLAMHRQAWDLAEDFLSKARKTHPCHLETWMKSAECAERRGDVEKATVYFQTSCQCAPNRPGPFVQYAELAMRTGHWEEALKRWEVVRTRFPDVPTGYLRAAEAARQLGRPKEARQLVLVHKYGADIGSHGSQSQISPKNQTGHVSLSWLIELVWTKAIFNLRSEVHRNYLSYGWWVLEPLLHMIVYYAVFGLLLHRGGENYTVFLLSGLIPWMWFTKAVNSSSGSIMNGQNLMLQVGIPPIVFPLVTILQATLKQIPVFILLFCFAWLQGYTPSAHWLAIVPVIIVQALLTIAIACTTAAVIPFIRDLAYLVPTGLMFLMFMSGIFYDYKSISPELQNLFLLNPIAFLLKCYREIFIAGTVPDLQTLTWWGLAGVIACLIVARAYARLRYTYPRIVIE